jgi:hypothetical protein
VATQTTTPAQKIYCPACGGFNIQANADQAPS